MVDQIRDTHTRSQQGGQDRPCGRADKCVEVTDIDASLVLESLKGTDHPRRAEDTATTEHQAPPGTPGHR